MLGAGVTIAVFVARSSSEHGVHGHRSPDRRSPRSRAARALAPTHEKAIQHWPDHYASAAVDCMKPARTAARIPRTRSNARATRAKKISLTVDERVLREVESDARRSGR